MHKIIIVSLALMSLIYTGCSKTEYKDGFYFAQEEDFASSGWKSTVSLVVEDGKIIGANWNGANRDGGTDKITRSSAGEYQMVAKGNAKAEWHVQSALTESYLLSSQDPYSVKYTDKKGNTDDISGVTIHVSEFFKLAAGALKAGPSGKGPYRDGTWHAEQADFSKKTGWKSTVDITVISGYIAAANWNGIHRDGGEDKKTRSKKNEYVMSAGGNPWHKQAAAAEAVLIKTQDPEKISYKDEQGHTDDISGVSIHVKEFFELAEKALVKD